MSLKNLAHLSGASAILALAILIGVAAVGFDLFWPEPAPAKSKLQRAKEEAELEASLKDLRGRQAQAKGLIATYAWEGDPRKVSADALASATEIAQECGVKLATFRPQRPGEAEGVVTLAYTMSLEGPFPNVHEFLRRLETKPSRLSVVRVQLASADGSSDKVNATVEARAYQSSKPVRSTEGPLANNQAASAGTGSLAEQR
ncbi:MAG: GspMb/PilO family protein [Fimbriimonadaceae bacterium]|nr:hypothetical protein [Fimbriimonadaceae bacterium]MCC6352104.1 hypothetical protein [Fimbriimonadaceae bacterium]MCL4285658.1 hypothetical protein [Fimbriimonadaceae bacterium]QOJ10683.1 MAG: hypothetical protein HRU74_00915 [Chthonomonadaceae bacterium]WKZ81281.1 MAG: GspMb/PilO family protein [Fimbriimonadaceae bacterium]